MSDSQGELFVALRRVVAAFDSLGIDYLIGGSVASSVHGEPRQTLDADLVAAVLGRHARALAETIGQEFYLDVAAIESAVRRQSCFNLIHLATMTKIDVFVSWRTAFGQEQMMRKQRIDFPDATSFYFASPEDTILAKLDWFKQGGGVSDRQWRDILGVIKVQGSRLDMSHLEKWARTLKIESLLASAVREAGFCP